MDFAICFMHFDTCGCNFGNWIQKRGQKIATKKAESQEEIAARVASIKALGEHNGKKKETTMDDDKNFNLLLNFLRDEDAEYRIAAAETLGKTLREAAFTYDCSQVFYSCPFFLFL